MKKSRRQTHKKPRQKVGAQSSASASAIEEATEISLPSSPTSTSSASASVSAGAGGGGAVAIARVERVSILTFIRQVRAEMGRITWPTRNETIVTTIMVFVMVVLAALFFLLADQILSFGVAWILGVR